jgi:hypothetical protein
MSGRLSIILDGIKSLLFYSFGRLDVADVRGYEGDEFLDANLRTSWFGLFGDKSDDYGLGTAGIVTTSGGETLVASGNKVDIGGNNKIHAQVIIQGEAGATGNVTVKFKIGDSPIDGPSDVVDTSLNIVVASSGANKVTKDQDLTITARYIRVYSITQSVGTDVDVEVRFYCAGFPVIM